MHDDGTSRAWYTLRYFGTYEDFSLSPDEEPGSLTGADNAVGDVYDIELKLNDGVYTAWIVNQFGHAMGYFSESFSKELALLAADAMVLKAILSFVAFTNYDSASDNENAAESENEGEDGSKEKKKINYTNYGFYWGSVAVVCYGPESEEAAEAYIKNIAAKIAADVRPQISLSPQAADKIEESGGSWVPAQTISLPDNKSGMTFIKRRRRVTEKIIDQGRAKNKGCYVLSWLIIIAFVLICAFGVKTCMGW